MSKKVSNGRLQGLEFNVLLDVAPVMIQPVIQYYANAGGSSRDAVVVGFRSKVEF
jgi:porin